MYIYAALAKQQICHASRRFEANPFVAPDFSGLRSSYRIALASANLPNCTAISTYLPSMDDERVLSNTTQAKEEELQRHCHDSVPRQTSHYVRTMARQSIPTVSGTWPKTSLADGARVGSHWASFPPPPLCAAPRGSRTPACVYFAAREQKNNIQHSFFARTSITTRAISTIWQFLQ